MPLTVLKQRREFLAVAASGRKCGTRGLVMQIRAHGAGEMACGLRYGLTASKRVGNAVQRNRAKRRLRAVAIALLPLCARPDHDYVLIARPETITRPFTDLQGDLRYALRKLGALTPS